SLFIHDGCAERSARLLHEVGLDERFEISIEHPVDVPDFELCSVVLDQLIRLEHITADLAAEADLLLGARNLLELRLLLLELQIEETRLEHAHRHGAVPMLRPLALARHDDPRGQMRNANGGVGDVDRLPACSAGPICVDPEIFLIDVDVHVIVEFRPDEDRGEGCMTTGSLVEWGMANETMHAGFGGRET